jgi:uncharacterized damage-inducible protein DinB
MQSSSFVHLSPEFALSTRDLTLLRFKREVTTTQRVISALSEFNRDWKPDPKSRSAWDLAWHICFRDVWFLDSIAKLSLDLECTGSHAKPNTFLEMAAWYGENVSDASMRVSEMTADQLLTPLIFFGHSQAAFLYLIFTSNHSIHHRGQLSVYVRPTGGKVPNIYGSSADEPYKT